MKKENQYTNTDLTRALIRQYLSQKGHKGTLSCFQREDSGNKKKISKNLLIQMTSLKNLCLINRGLPKGEATLLEILVAYLNKKYQAKSNLFNKTEPQFYNREVQKKNGKKVDTMDYGGHKFTIKERPSTSKGSKRDQSVKSAQLYQRAELKVIYDKVAKVEEQSKTKDMLVDMSRVQGEKSQVKEQGQSNAKIPSNSDIFDLPEGLPSKSNVDEQHIFNKFKPESELRAEIEGTSKSIREESKKGADESYMSTQKHVSSKVEQKKPAESMPNIQPIDIEDEYNEDFDLLQLKQNTVRPQAQMFQLDNTLVSRKILSQQQSRHLPSLPIIQQQLASRSNTGSLREGHKQSQIVVKVTTTEYVAQGGRQGCDDEVRTTLANRLDEYEYNTLPIVNKMSTKVEQYELQVDNITSPIMGGLINGSKDQVKEVKEESPKKVVAQLPVEVEVEKKDSVKIDDQIVKPDVKQEEPPSKPRTQMRMLGKNREPKRSVQFNADVQILHSKIQIVKEEDVPHKKEEEKVIPPQGQPKKPVMVAIGKKKKAKQDTAVESYPTKFKFDDNFSHGIPVEVSYDYEPFKVDTFILEQKVQEQHPWMILQNTINYKVKGGNLPPLKKKQQKSIASKDAERLRTTVFQSSPPVLPKSWSQGFILSPHESTPYGLRQIQGGPCGIIAAVQCYYLKHLLACAKDVDLSNQTVREMALVGAIANLLWKVRSSDKITLTFPPKGAGKIDINNLRVLTYDAIDFNAAFAGVWACRDEFIGEKNFGVAALLYSAVLTKGSQRIEEEVDIKTNPLIGNHGHCTQQFVNLALTGKACSNLFDGEKTVDQYKIRGIEDRSQFGFLTVFEALGYIQVGQNMKNPIVPAWVICKEFHYHVIFAQHHLIALNNKTPKFDMIYFDGLYNCGDRIRLTLSPMSGEEEEGLKVKELPLIEQVMMTKWGGRKGDWNGSTKIL